MDTRRQCRSCNRLFRNLTLHQETSGLINCRLNLAPHELVRSRAIAAPEGPLSALPKAQHTPQQSAAGLPQDHPDPPEAPFEADHPGAEQAVGLEEHPSGEGDGAAQQYQHHVSLHEDVAAFAQLSCMQGPILTPALAPGKGHSIKCRRQAFTELARPAEDAAEDDYTEDEEDQFSNLSAHERLMLPLLMKMHKPDRAALLRLGCSLGARVRWRSCQDLDDHLQHFEVHPFQPHPNASCNCKHSHECLGSCPSTHQNEQCRRQRSGKRSRS